MRRVQPSPSDVGSKAGPAAPPGAVLLLGHGSEHSPASGRPVRALARELRRRWRPAEVKVGFWRERPYLHEVLWTVRARRVAVVPIFTSEGYYTERVIPRELGLHDAASRPPGLAVRLCPPVGTHPGIVEVVLDRARPEAEEGAALVLVGHGTPRHPTSGQATRKVARELRKAWSHGPVAPAFLDEPPTVEEVIGELGVPTAVVVPFFISEGWHAGVTLPRSLEVKGRRGKLGTTPIRYTAPVGTHPRLADFVEELALEGLRARVSGRAVE